MKLAGTVKSVPAVALTPAAVNVTAVADRTGLSNAAVTVTAPAPSATVNEPNDTDKAVGAGLRTVTTASSTLNLA